MKVLLVSPFPEDPKKVRGGVEAAASRLVSAMFERHGTMYDLLPYEEPSPAADYSLWPQVNVIARLPQQRGQRVSARSMRRLISRLEASERYDVIHVQGPASFVSRSARQLVTIHGISERDSLFASRRPAQRLRAAVVKIREWLGRNRARNVITISDYVRSVLPRESGKRLWKIPNAVDDALFSQARTSGNERTVLFAGRVTEIKNVLGLIDAFLLAHQTQEYLKLRIVGPGLDSDYGRLCRERAAALPPGVVAFVGDASATQLADEMSRASVLALFSWQENAPMVVAEALAAGVPVVATSVGGLPEMIGSRNGELVAPGDVVAFAESLCRVSGWQLTPEKVREVRATATKYRGAAVAEATMEAYRAIRDNSASAVRRGIRTQRSHDDSLT